MRLKVEFTKHAKDRLLEMGLNEEDGRKMLDWSVWYTVPLGNLHHKLNTKQSQFGIVYYIYRKRHKEYPTVLFTIREYKTKMLVITATKKGEK